MCWFVNTCEHAEVPPLSVESDRSTRATHTHIYHAHTHGHNMTAISICEYSVLCTGYISVMFSLLPWQQTFGAHTSYPVLSD